MQFDYVLCQGGVWKNVPGFMARDYKDRRTLNPSECWGEKSSVWLLWRGFSERDQWIPGEGDCLWRLLELSCSTESLEEWAGTNVPHPPSNDQNRAAESGPDMQGPTCTDEHQRFCLPALRLSPAGESLWVTEERETGSRLQQHLRPQDKELAVQRQAPLRPRILGG